jgi:hypothetical protein
MTYVIQHVTFSDIQRFQESSVVGRPCDDDWSLAIMHGL